MSKKRNSAAFESDDQTNGDSGASVLQREDNAKHAKLTSLSDTTLQDLPIEMLERILVQAVVMEVKEMTTAKSVWKDKAGLVIIRLTNVCSQWSSILTTDFFRNEVNGILDGTAQEASRLEILHQYPLPCEVSKVTANKEEIFLLLKQAQHDLDRVINVYDRNNMAEAKDVILLPRRTDGADIMLAACGISRCLYVLFIKLCCPGFSIFRITRDDKHQFNISPWISDRERSSVYNIISVSANGSLMIASRLRHRWDTPAVRISAYNADGFLQHKINLPPDVDGFNWVENVIQKTDGNFVVASTNRRLNLKLTEFDAKGTILRQHRSSVHAHFLVVLGDIYDRILISASRVRIELLDSKLNVLEFAGPQLDKNQFIIPRRLDYSSASNELIDVVYDEKFKNGVLTLFRLT